MIWSVVVITYLRVWIGKILSVLDTITKSKQKNPSVEADSAQLMKNVPVRYGVLTLNHNSKTIGLRPTLKLVNG